MEIERGALLVAPLAPVRRLSQAKIVADDATLDARSLAAVRMPNRDGFIPDARPEKLPPPEKAPHSEAAAGG